MPTIQDANTKITNFPNKFVSPFGNEEITPFYSSVPLRSPVEGCLECIVCGTSIDRTQETVETTQSTTTISIVAVIAEIFTGSVNGNWSNILNWTDKDGNPATALPTLSSDVTILKDVTQQTSSAFAHSANFLNSADNRITLQVSDQAIFNSGSLNKGKIVGNTKFNYLTSNNNICVDVTRYANGEVTGVTRDSIDQIITSWVFNGTGYFSNTSSLASDGAATGSCTFNAATVYGKVIGSANLIGNAYLFGSIIGNCTLTGNTLPGNCYTAGGSSVSGNLTLLNSTWFNGGNVSGNLYLYDNSSTIVGRVHKNVIFTYTSTSPDGFCFPLRNTRSTQIDGSVQNIGYPGNCVA